MCPMCLCVSKKVIQKKWVKHFQVIDYQQLKNASPIVGNLLF